MIAESDKMMWLGPTPEMLNDPLFEAIWQTIKTWDVNVPEAYSGYCGANGNHVRAIFEAARRLSAPAAVSGLNRTEVLNAIKWFGWQNDGRWATPEMANLWERIASMGTPVTAPAAPLPSREQMVRAAQKQINVEFSDKRPHKNGDPLAERIADAILALASATAPAAPRVGGDATGLEQWTDAEAIAGLRSDAADIHGRRLHMLANRMRDAAARIERLSAPPAASAEREDRVQVADEMRSYFYEDAAECSPHKYAEFLQCADIALGYRKRAAQGMDDEIEQTLRDAVQAAILQLEYLNESQSRGTTESTLARLRHALSALPKGQEHE